VSPPTDRFALAVGVALSVLAVSGLLDNSGLLRHEWWWAVGVIVVGAATAVAAGIIRTLVRPPQPADDPPSPTGQDG
jgi:uncharacterized membrane protein YeiH